MRNPGGSAVWTSPDGQKQECDTFSCAHCNRVVFVAAVRAEAPTPDGTGAVVKTTRDPRDCGGFCRACMKAICTACTDLGRCTPLEKRLEEHEARARMLAAIGV